MRHSYVGFACAERLVQSYLEVYMEQNSTWTRLVERAHDADLVARQELEEYEVGLLEKARAATEPVFETSKQQFVKQQKKLNKKFK